MTLPPPPDTTAALPHRSPPRRRRRLVVVAVLVALVLLAVVLLWFQPQTLLFDTVVEDDFPTTTPLSAPADVEGSEAPTAEEAATEPDEPDEEAVSEEAAEEAAVAGEEAGEEAAGEEAAGEEAAGADADPPAPAEGPVALLTGSFDSRNRYTVTGNATAYELPDATRVLRLEGFESTNGPDLFVYLTVGDATEPDDAALAAEYLDLGELRGNIGNQNYPIPDEVDLARFDTVVIWCRRFETAFGAADLS